MVACNGCWISRAWNTPDADAASSALCFNKQRTKDAAAAAGVRVCPGVAFLSNRRPSAASIVAQLGDQLVLKPNCSGSSVGLHVISQRHPTRCDPAAARCGRVAGGAAHRGARTDGRPPAGRAMGVVEIVPKSGLFDYTSKYTKGLTEYLAPAPVPIDVEIQAKQAAEAAFQACGCRDYARMDFMLSEKERIIFPRNQHAARHERDQLAAMSARCAGLDFTMLVRELVAPALERFKAATLAHA